MIDNRYGLLGNILLLIGNAIMLILMGIGLALLGCSCSHVTVPAYPAYIADEPIIWTEAGKSVLIDKTGVHELK